ncbi:secretory lipase-domain-containing protein [Dipodascopsis tothii]|uniref:secretory lipase-domain-containing protein n=1 Tax=Dipodascopsis tothii TaxID=44089 RepID=UPI0034CE079F
MKFFCAFQVAATFSLLVAEVTALLGNLDRTAIDPSNDTFYDMPDDVSGFSLGEIIKSRQAPGSVQGISHYSKAYQLIYRTTDSFGNAASAITTVVVPPNATHDKLLSYQIAEDASYIGCAPSYYVQTSDVEEGILRALEEGWYVNIPDYEGPQSAFTAGHLAGRLVLDSLRAALQSNNITGLESNATVALWGYSGGSLATGWAAELQPWYAPDLNIAGAAVGGFVVNITAVVLNVNNSTGSGFIASGISGLGNEYPAFQKVINESLVPNTSATFTRTEDQCLTADLLTFLGQDIFSYFKQGIAILDEPTVKNVTSNQTMGETTPIIPLYVYQSVDDEIAPYQNVDDTVAGYCSDGATVEYMKSNNNSHTAEADRGGPYAFDWIKSRLAGSSVKIGCATSTIVFSTDWDGKNTLTSTASGNASASATSAGVSASSGVSASGTAHGPAGVSSTSASAATATQTSGNSSSSSLISVQSFLLVALAILATMCNI